MARGLARAQAVYRPPLQREVATPRVWCEGENTMRHCLRLLLLALMLLTSTVYAQEGAPLRLVQTVPLPHVEGRMDHMAVDLQAQRLFVAALGNNTLEVLDLQAGTHLHTITGLHEPQGVCSLTISIPLCSLIGQHGMVTQLNCTCF